MKLKSIQACVFGILSIGTLSGFSAAPPNIIFLLTDDQRWNALGSMGNEIIKTPEVDALSKQGVTFDNAFCTTAICYASRATIFTGQHLSRNGMYNFSSVLSADALPKIYPRILKDNAGYFTGFIGKWGLGDQPTSSFDKWWGFKGQGEYEIITNGKVTGHLTPKMGDQALDFLTAAKASNKPFCLQISFKAPHIQDKDPRQYIPDPDDMDLYVSDKIPSPPLTAPAFYNALPPFLKDSNSELRERWEKHFSTPALFQESMKNYYRLISGADHVVGRIRKKLTELGLDNNTILIFSSDHGYFTGDRGYSGKWMAYQVSSRVPMIIYDPRLPAEKRGKRYNDIVLNLDIPTTILGLAGVKSPAGMQGRNMMNLVDGTDKTWRSEFFFEHDYPAAAPPTKAVITHEFSYIVYHKENPKYEELYDLQKDPNEEFNIIANPKYKSVLDSMRLRFKALEASAAKDDAVKELQMPASSPTTKLRSTAWADGKTGHRLSRSIQSGRQTFTSFSGYRYDGSGRQIINPELEQQLFQGD